MDNETRQKRIEELKALRAELMAYKEETEGESGESSASNSNMAAMRKMYVGDADATCEYDSDASKYEDVRQELYSQQNQETEENSEAKQMTLTRRR